LIDIEAAPVAVRLPMMELMIGVIADHEYVTRTDTISPEAVKLVQAVPLVH
jgi:hypothetical protein